MGISLQRFNTAGEAAIALNAGQGLRCLGGGTLVVRAANNGDVSLKGYVSYAAPTEKVKIQNGLVELDSSVTMSEVIGCEALAWLAPAARCIGGPAIRNMATIGGNLFAPAPFGDFSVALLALQANVVINRAGTSHEIPLSEFFPGRHSTWQSSVVISIKFRAPQQAKDFKFSKISRIKPKGTSVVSIAALVSEENGVIRSASVAYGAMGPHPIRARAVEDALLNKPRDSDGISAAVALANDGTEAFDDAIASAWYRQQVLPVHLKRLLLA